MNARTLSTILAVALAAGVSACAAPALSTALALSTVPAQADLRENRGKLPALASDLGYVGEQEIVCAKTEEFRLRGERLLADFELLLPLAVAEPGVKPAMAAFEAGRGTSLSRPSPEVCRDAAGALGIYELYLVKVRFELALEAQDRPQIAAALARYSALAFGWADACGIETTGAAAKVEHFIQLISWPNVHSTADVMRGGFIQTRAMAYREIHGGGGPDCAYVGANFRTFNAELDDVLAR